MFPSVFVAFVALKELVSTAKKLFLLLINKVSVEEKRAFQKTGRAHLEQWVNLCPRVTCDWLHTSF